MIRFLCKIYKCLMMTFSLDELVDFQCPFILVGEMDVNIFTFKSICSTMLNEPFEVSFSFATLFAFNFLGLLQLVTGKTSSGSVPLVINRRSGCANLQRAASSWVISLCSSPDMFLPTALGITVCRFRKPGKHFF